MVNINFHGQVLFAFSEIFVRDYQIISSDWLKSKNKFPAFLHSTMRDRPFF